MSLDLLLAVRERPTRAMIESHLRSTGWRLRLSGELDDGATLEAEARRLFWGRRVFHIRARQTQHRLLPRLVRRVIEGHAVLLEIQGAPTIKDDEAQRAEELAVHLAMAFEGAVLDVGTNRLLFPDRAAAPAPAPDVAEPTVATPTEPAPAEPEPEAVATEPEPVRSDPEREPVAVGPGPEGAADREPIAVMAPPSEAEAAVPEPEPVAVAAIATPPEAPPAEAATIDEPALLSAEPAPGTVAVMVPIAEPPPPRPPVVAPPPEPARAAPPPPRATAAPAPTTTVEAPKPPPARPPQLTLDAVLTPTPTLHAIRVLTLEWYLPDRGPQNGGRLFLEAVRRTWPEALPVRFGPDKALEFKLTSATGEDDFEATWATAQARGGSFIWKSGQPVFGGTASWSPESTEPEGTRRRVLISMNLNATAIEDEAAAWERAVELFAALAGDLGAFFGAGYVVRNMQTGDGGALWFGGKSENFAFDWVGGPWWIGIPPKPTWLSWFGDPYGGLVRPGLGELMEERGPGLLVRLGPAPMDSDEVKGRMPALPPDVTVGMQPVRSKVKQQDSGKRPILYWERMPAARIPKLQSSR